MSKGIPKAARMTPRGHPPHPADSYKYSPRPLHELLIERAEWWHDRADLTTPGIQASVHMFKVLQHGHLEPLPCTMDYLDFHCWLCLFEASMQKDLSELFS